MKKIFLILTILSFAVFASAHDLEKMSLTLMDGTQDINGDINQTGDFITSGGIGISGTYFVYYDGSANYRVKDLTDGSIDYENSDANVTVQWAIDNAPDATVTETDTVINKETDGELTRFYFFLPNLDPTTFTFKHTTSSTEYTSNADTDDGDGTGVCTGTNITSCDIDYRTGVVTVVFTAAPDDNSSITGSWQHGRTHYVKIVLSGDFEFSTTVDLKDFTDIECVGGVISHATNVADNEAIFGIYYQGKGIGYYKIHGCVLDGRVVEQTVAPSAQYGIKIPFSRKCFVYDNEFRNFITHGVAANNNEQCVFERNTFIGSGDDGLSLEDASYNTATHNIFDFSRSGGDASPSAPWSTNSAGIEIEGAAVGNIVTHNMFSNMNNSPGYEASGIQLNQDSAGSVHPEGNIVAFNTFVNVNAPLKLRGDSGKILEGNMLFANTIDGTLDNGSSNEHGITVSWAQNNIISNNTIRNTDGRAIFSSNASRNIYSGNISRGSGSHAFYAFTASPDNIWVGNIAEDSNGGGFRVYTPTTTGNLFQSNFSIGNTNGFSSGNSAASNIIKDNFLLSNSVDYSGFGVTDIITGNIDDGEPQSNDGIASGIDCGATVAHGLSGTPDWGIAQATNDADASVLSGISVDPTDGTNITINCTETAGDNDYEFFWKAGYWPNK